MVQFFLALNDDVMGLDFDEPTSQKNFRVVYHKEVVKDESLLVNDFSYLPDYDEDFLPIDKELYLSFQLDIEGVSPSDFQFESMVGNIPDKVVGKDSYGDITLMDVFCEELSNGGHKIGGYAHFTQEDPRGYDGQLQEYKILLFQMDSEDEKGIMWGDMGVGNFFIRKEDLERLDFSKVLYNWDCS